MLVGNSFGRTTTFPNSILTAHQWINVMTDPAIEALIEELSEGELQKISPARVLGHIQKLFKKWGIFDKKLTLKHEGAEYAFSCHEKAFVVYRLLALGEKPSGTPGWPVCLVTAEGVIDECSPPYPDEDYVASNLVLADWLIIIQQYYGQP